ncbi:hypothetical protein niasHT_024976 [Heterodera trifolii]|uniref:Uncharacterized protein n=1 Tax=Heterodera trifolii TaxID=157864 RepID=A0ABD2KSY8_9BILA
MTTQNSDDGIGAEALHSGQNDGGGGEAGAETTAREVEGSKAMAEEAKAVDNGDESADLRVPTVRKRCSAVFGAKTGHTSTSDGGGVLSAPLTSSAMLGKKPRKQSVLDNAKSNRRAFVQEEQLEPEMESHMRSKDANSPLPSGFLDTTRTIFRPLMLPKTPVDVFSKYGSLDEMNKTHVIQHTPFHTRFQSPLLLDDLTKKHASSLLFDSQDNYGLDELSADARLMKISAGAMTMITETPKSSHHSTATRTVPIDFEDDRVSESPQLPPPPTVPIPMGHLNDSEFEQWHETEMDEAMEGYCDAVKQYTDKYSRLAAEKKRLLSRIDAVKARSYKFRYDFSEAYQQNEEKRRALCANLTNI